MTTMLTAAMIGIAQSISDELLLMDQRQIPLISRLGLGSITDRVLNTKHEWTEDSLFPTKSTLTAGMNNTSDTVANVASATPFRVNQIIRIDDEFMRITQINSLALTVTRNVNGTSIGTHSSSAEVEVMANNSTEGATARAARQRARVNNFNYCQIFDDTISISDTALAVRNLGIDQLYDYERIKLQMGMAANLENALVKGVKYQSGDDRYMGGLRSAIASNIEDANSAEVTIDIINAAVEKIWNAGGFTAGAQHVILCSGTQKRFMSNINLTGMNIPRGDRIVGNTIDSVQTDHGLMEVIAHPACINSEILIVDLNRVEVKPLREFTHTYLGKTGDKTEGLLVGEYTAEIKQEAAMAKITGLATSPVEE
jgi:hypothetical protein